MTEKLPIRLTIKKYAIRFALVGLIWSFFYVFSHYESFDFLHFTDLTKLPHILFPIKICADIAASSSFLCQGLMLNITKSLLFIALLSLIGAVVGAFMGLFFQKENR